MATTYMFGQSNAGNSWFIQELLAGGKMGPKETDSGNWEKYYDTAFSFIVAVKLTCLGKVAATLAGLFKNFLQMVWAPKLLVVICSIIAAQLLLFLYNLVVVIQLKL